MTPELQRKWIETLANDWTACAMVRSGCSIEEIVVQLASQKRYLQEEIKKLSSIAPRKYRMPNGNVVVWHCPDDQIPETKL